MEGLGLNNILGQNEIDTLFEDAPENTAEETADVKEDDKETDSKEKDIETEQTTEAVDPDTLFDEEEGEVPESVGSGDIEDKGDTATVETGTSPTFYSSIANALAVDGIFPNLDEETIKKANTAEGLSDLIEAEVNARLDERQRRVADALNNGVEPDNIRKYEQTLNYIDSIKESDIVEESEKGEQLRFQLIFQDFVNKGYSRDRAEKLAKRSIDAGTDVEDAKDALQGNRDFFQGAYTKLLKEAETAAEQEKAARQKQTEALRNSIMKDKDLFGDIELSTEIRKKTVDNIFKPIYKDPETGEYLTALQKYEMENRADFLKYVGLTMTLTNNFKDFESFTKGKVRREVKKGLKELEKTLNNTRRNTDGSLNLVSSAKDDSESVFGKGLRLNL